MAPGYWDSYAGLPSPWNQEDHSEGDPDYDEDEPEVLCLQLFEAVDNDHSAGQISAIAKIWLQALMLVANTHHDLESDSKHNHMENEGR